MVRTEVGAAMPASTGDARSVLVTIFERPAGDRGIDSAQHVVGAELDDHGVRSFRHRPVQAREAARGGVAGDARIADLGGDTPGFERPFELRRERPVGR
jgi:hypothetical protein